MLKYIIKRCLLAICTLFVLVSIIFVLVRMLPGNPFQNEKTPPEIRVKMERYYGLDKPILEQWLKYMGNLLKGDLGESLKYKGRTINSTISQTFHYSADLGIRALALALVTGLTLGILASKFSGRLIDYLCVIIAIIGVSVPDFVSGTLLRLGFAINLGWFSATRWEGLRSQVLPVIALSFGTTALITRLMRSSMMDVKNQDYILTAKAKGLSPFEIIWRHQIRNAILPVVTVMGPIVAGVLTGTFVVERIYAIPGMGKFYVQSLNDLDYTMVLGMTVFYGMFLVLAMLAVDIIYGVVDPRIKLAEKKYKTFDEE